MSLRLVTPADACPANEIALAARAFADKIECGEVNAQRVIVVAVIDGLLDFSVFGPSPTIAEGVGMLELAKAKVIQGSWR